MGYLGYPRENGTAGARNHVVAMSSVSCANAVVAAIANAVPGVKPITHAEGCGRGPRDLVQTTRTLVGLATNPNVAAVLVVGLGCEFIQAPMLAAQVAASGKPVECLVIQDLGGSRTTTRRGIAIAEKLVARAAAQERREVGWETLTLAVECGGSDAMSGVTANPMTGVAADWLVREGGRVLLSETTEMTGTEHILARRAATPEVGERVIALVQGQERRARELLGPLADLAISPGNAEGGLTNIREKSLGCIVKGGTSPIRDVIEYGETPRLPGLSLMDTPGSDLFSMTGLAAGGAQIMVFTTGRGTPAGFPILPVIKVATNGGLFARMNEDMDLNAGKILEGVSIQDAGAELIAFIARVASGEPTKAEINGQDLLAIHTLEPAF